MVGGLRGDIGGVGMDELWVLLARASLGLLLTLRGLHRLAMVPLCGQLLGSGRCASAGLLLAQTSRAGAVGKNVVGDYDCRRLAAAAGERRSGGRGWAADPLGRSEMREPQWGDTVLALMGYLALFAVPFAVLVTFSDWGSDSGTSSSASSHRAWPWVWALVLVGSSVCGFFVLRRCRGQ